MQRQNGSVTSSSPTYLKRITLVPFCTMVIVHFLLSTLINCQVILYSYPTTHLKTTISIEGQTDRFQWTEVLNNATYMDFVKNYYDPKTGVNESSFYSIAGQMTILTSINQCVIVYENSTANFIVHYEDRPNGAWHIFADITTLVGSVSATNTTEFQISKNCQNLRIDIKVFKWNGVSYDELTLPWTLGAVYDDNLQVALNYLNNNLFVYKSSVGNFELNHSIGSLAHEKIYRLGEKVVIYSSQSASNGQFIYQVVYLTLISQTLTEFGSDNSPANLVDDPTVFFNHDMTMLVITSQYANNSGYQRIINIDYDTPTKVDVTVPTEIFEVQCYISLSANYIYARHIFAIGGANKKHYVYKVMGTDTILVLEEDVGTTRENGWEKTLIYEDNAYGYYLVHQQDILSVISLVKEDHLRSLDDVIAQNQGVTSPTPQILTYPPLTNLQFYYSTSFLSNTQSFFFYGEENTPGGTLKYTKVDYTAVTHSSMSSDMIMGQEWEVICIEKEDMNAAILYNNINNTIWTFGMDLTSPLIFGSEITNVFSNNGVTDYSTVDIKVNNDKTAFRIDDKIFWSPFVTLVQEPSTVGWSSVETDKTFRIAIEGNTLYQYGGSGYSLRATSPFRTNNTIKLSADSTKIAIFSINDIPSSGGYLFEAYYYYFDGTLWNSIPTGISGSHLSSMQKPVFQVSEDFSIIALSYVDTTGSGVMQIRYFQPSILQVDVISTGEEFADRVEVMYFTLGNAHLYYRKNTPSSSPDQEAEHRFYLIDKVGLSLSRQRRDFLSSYIVQDWVQTVVIDQVLFTVAHQYHYSSSSKFLVIKENILNDVTEARRQALKQVSKTSHGALTNLFMCSAGCETCFSSGMCNSCYPGYVLDLDTLACKKCKYPCKDCTQTDLQTCTSCFPGHYLLSGTGQCPLCISPCITCLSATRCESCEVGKGVDNLVTGYCVSCTIEGCDICAEGKCMTCQSGYVTATDKFSCIQCPSYCSHCNLNAITDCKECLSSFGLVTVTLVGGFTYKKCEKCPVGCSSCEEGSCTSCLINYLLSGSACSELCDFPCQECSSGVISDCSFCFQEYTASPPACNPTSCTSGACTICPHGSTLIDQTCWSCDTGDANCIRCSPYNIQDCMDCKIGYFVDSNFKCSSCGANCQMCHTQKSCQLCSDGYFLNNLVESQCEICSGSCLTCVKTQNSCTSCVVGYVLEGWKCIPGDPTLNAGFEFTLDTNLLGITGSVYELIGKELEINTQRGSSIQVTIIEIDIGSVLMRGILSANGPIDMTKIFYSVYIFNSGNSLGGIPIIQSTVQFDDDFAPTYTPDPPPPTEQEETDSQPSLQRQNLGEADIFVTVMCSIPMILVLVVVYVLLLCKKAKNAISLGASSGKIGKPIQIQPENQRTQENILNESNTESVLNGQLFSSNIAKNNQNSMSRFSGQTQVFDFRQQSLEWE